MFFTIPNLSLFTLLFITLFTRGQNMEIVIDDFSERGIWSWWGSTAIQVEHNRTEQHLVVHVHEAGKTSIDNGHSTFGRDIPRRPLDLNETPIVKLRIKCDHPVNVRMNVKDIIGHVNNINHIIKPVSGKNEYEDLYFDFSKNWKQNWPLEASVNATKIKEFIIFINPGGKPWSGTCYIDTLSILPSQNDN